MCISQVNQEADCERNLMQLTIAFCYYSIRGHILACKSECLLRNFILIEQMESFVISSLWFFVLFLPVDISMEYSFFKCCERVEIYPNWLPFQMDVYTIHQIYLLTICTQWIENQNFCCFYFKVEKFPSN